MARFYVTFDGSDVTALNSQYFDKVTITDGANKKSRLIESRSILSAEVYDDLRTEFRNGSLGTYFPPDEFNTQIDPSPAFAYTSSIQGIQIPADYRTRPTASVLSTDARVREVTPPNQVNVSYASYINASTAVKSVLDSVSNGGPFARLGFDPSRTLHSIWHDPDLQYFAWDDFTPGTPQNFTAGVAPSSINRTFSETANITLSWSTQFLGDRAGNALIRLYLTGDQPTPYEVVLQRTSSVADLADVFTINSADFQTGSYTVTAQLWFQDATILEHVSALAQPATAPTFTVTQSGGGSGGPSGAGCGEVVCGVGAVCVDDVCVPQGES